MFGFFLTLHIAVAFFLVGVILLQGGRGGLGEALGGSGGSSLFGGGGNVVMRKITGVGAAVFMVTCLLLAKLSSERGRSVTEQVPITLPDILPQPGALPLPTGTGATTDVDATPAAPVPSGTPGPFDAETAPYAPEDSVMAPEQPADPIAPPD